MSGKRPFHHTQFEVWITTEASKALNDSAAMHDLTRGEYVQNAIWEAIGDHTDKPRTELLPRPRSTALDAIRTAQPKPGYKGRWSMWVRARCTVHNSVPMILTRAAGEQGFGSASAYLRHHLAILIKTDTGKTVPMPKGRSAADLFGGKIHEEVR